MDFRRPEEQQAPRVFYPLRRGVLVTGRWFFAPSHRFAVKEIGNVGWRQSSARIGRRVARKILLTEILLVASVAVVASAIGGLSLIALMIAALHLTVVAFVTWLSAYRYPGPLQLWGENRGGAQILLFSSSDQTEFHKVRRAMERAIEYDRELAL